LLCRDKVLLATATDAAERRRSAGILAALAYWGVNPRSLMR
jgi:hypothetical protein